MGEDYRAAGLAAVGIVVVAVHALVPAARPVVAGGIVVLGALLAWFGGRAGRRAGVVRGVGVAGLLVGAVMVGQVLAAAVEVPARFGPGVLLGPVVVVLLALALVGGRGTAGWAGNGTVGRAGNGTVGRVGNGTVGWVGLGVVAPTVIGIGMGAPVVLAVAVAAAGLAWMGRFWGVLAATAAASSAGAGADVVLAVTGIGASPVGMGVGAGAVAVGVAVAVPLWCAVVAVVRRDLPVGVVAGAALAVPPQGASWLPVAVVGVVVVGSVLVVGPLRAYSARSGQVSREMALAWFGGLAVVAAVIGTATLGWGNAVLAGVAIALLAPAAVLAWWLPRRLGGPLGGVVLVGMALCSPWQRWGVLDGDPVIGLAVFSGFGLVVSAAVGSALWVRHAHPGVAAGAAYLVLRELAWLLTSALGLQTSDVAVVGPLVAVAVAGLLVRPALGVALAAAGFTLAAMTVRTFTPGGVDLARTAPLTPTDVLLAAEVPAHPAWAGCLLVVALLGARSPAAALVVLFGTQAVLVAL